MVSFLQHVEMEVNRARDEHIEPIPTMHAGYAIILEELDEFWDEVKKKPEQRSVPVMMQELVQIAAMCLRTAEDLHYVEAYRPR